MISKFVTLSVKEHKWKHWKRKEISLVIKVTDEKIHRRLKEATTHIQVLTVSDVIKSKFWIAVKSTFPHPTGVQSSAEKSFNHQQVVLIRFARFLVIPIYLWSTCGRLFFVKVSRNLVGHQKSRCCSHKQRLRLRSFQAMLSLVPKRKFINWVQWMFC